MSEKEESFDWIQWYYDSQGIPRNTVNDKEYPTTDQQWRNDIKEGYNPYDNYLGVASLSDELQKIIVRRES